MDAVPPPHKINDLAYIALHYFTSLWAPLYWRVRTASGVLFSLRDRFCINCNIIGSTSSFRLLFCAYLYTWHCLFRLEKVNTWESKHLGVPRNQVTWDLLSNIHATMSLSTVSQRFEQTGRCRLDQVSTACSEMHTPTPTNAPFTCHRQTDPDSPHAHTHSHMPDTLPTVYLLRSRAGPDQAGLLRQLFASWGVTEQ